MKIKKISDCLKDFLIAFYNVLLNTNNYLKREQKLLRIIKYIA